MKTKTWMLALMAMMTCCLSACNTTGSASELVYIHSWTAEGLGGHFYSGAEMGPVSWYVVEGLGDFLRTEDIVYYTTAKNIIHHDDDTSEVVLRDDVYWQGRDEHFVGKDLESFYYLNTTGLTSYVTSIEAQDDTHVIFHWNKALEPADEVKTLLLVTDRVACAPYSVFKTFADKAKSLYDAAPLASSQDGTLKPFGKEVSAEANIELSKNYSAYQSYQPSIFPATGPYQIDAYNANEMILKKNPRWYDAAKVGFSTIRLINSVGDISLSASMLINGEIDFLLNTPSKPMVDNILSANEAIAFYKIRSPFAQGLNFNMQKKALWSDHVREAFQYLIDRDEVRKLSCYYGVTSWSSTSGMTDSDEEKWMSTSAHETRKNQYTYTYDLAKAETLLKEAGWVRKSGKWYDSNSHQLTLVIGYDGSNGVPSAMAEAVQAQLSNFGISASLKRASSYGEFYAMATQKDSPYDLVCTNTSYNSSYSYPSSCFQQFYNSGVGATANLTYLKNTLLNGKNGETIMPVDYVDKMLTLSGEQLTDTVDNLVLGVSRLNVGLNMFQEVSGGLYNQNKIGGLPYPEKAQENRDVQYIPSHQSEDHVAMLYTILYYDHGSALYNGRLYPRSSEGK